MTSVGSVGVMDSDEAFGIEQEISTPLKRTYNNELKVGTIFKTVEEARVCYEKYAGSHGFSIRRKGTDKSKSSGVEIGILFACCCEGFHNRKNAIDDDGKTKRLGSTSRSGCKAKMRLKLLEASGSWEVSIFNDVHNHELVTPSKRMHLKSNKIVPREAKLLAERFNVENIRVSKVRTLFTFVTKYDQALLQIYVSERKEDYISIHKTRSLPYTDFLLNHAAEIYTRNLFVKFLEEYNTTHVMRCDKMESVGDVGTYLVWSMVGDSYKWIVAFNSATKEGSCRCKLFEFYGLPCRHLLSIFKILYLNEIPAYFIANRWTKKANRVQVCAPDGTIMRSKNIGIEAARIFEICQKATQLAYIMCPSDEGFEKLREHIDKGFDMARDMDKVMLKFENELAIDDDHPSEGAGTSNNIGGLLLDPHISQTKGRKKAVKEGNEMMSSSSQKSTMLETGNNRFKSPIEKQQRTCKQCFGKHQWKHDFRNCPDNPINIKKKDNLHSS